MPKTSEPPVIEVVYNPDPVTARAARTEAVNLMIQWALEDLEREAPAGSLTTKTIP